MFMKIHVQCVILILFAAVLCGTSLAAEDEPFDAITQPSYDGILSFTQPGQIADIPVRQGQSVKSGELLAQQDDEVEATRLERLKAEAQSEIRIRASKARLDQSRVDYKKLKWAAERDAASEFEVDHAKLEVTINELSLELTGFEHRQAQREYEEFRKQVSRMKLTSPIDGVVEKVFVEEGESVNALDKVVRVVRINPLWIDVPVPMTRARELAVGGKARVVYSGGEEATEGEIIHVASVADSASETLTVRISAANPKGRPAGEHVKVSFSALKKAANVHRDKTDRVEEISSATFKQTERADNGEEGNIGER